MPDSPFDRPDLYDLLFEDLLFDLECWMRFVREGEGPALEVACGTGRLLVRMREAGLEVDGLDSSTPMLQEARAKLQRSGCSAELTRASMTGFALPRRYRRIYCAFNSFAHNLTVQDQLTTLECCRTHLAPDGVFGLHLSFPRPELWTGPTERVLEREVALQDGRSVRIYDDRTLDPVHQTQVSRIEVEDRDADGSLRTTSRSETVLRWVYKNELELLFARAGFTRVVIHGDFERGPLTPASDTMIAFAAP